MSDVVIEALAGALTGPLLVSEVAQLMAAQGTQWGTAARIGQAQVLLDRLKAGGLLLVRLEVKREPIPGKWRWPVPWEHDKHGPKYQYKDLVVLPCGREGFWWTQEHVSDPDSLPAGAEPCTREVRTERIAPEDCAALLRGPLGESVRAEGFVTPALEAWLKTAGEGVTGPMQRKHLVSDYVFVKADGTVHADSGQVLKELREHGLQGADPSKQGTYFPEDVKRAALQQGLTMRKRGATATSDGTLAFQGR